MSSKWSSLLAVSLTVSTIAAAAPHELFNIISCERKTPVTGDKKNFGEIQRLDFYFDPFTQVDITEVKGLLAIEFVPLDGLTNRLLVDYLLTKVDGVRADFQLSNWTTPVKPYAYQLTIPGFNPEGKEPLKNLKASLKDSEHGVPTEFTCSSPFRP